MSPKINIERLLEIKKKLRAPRFRLIGNRSLPLILWNNVVLCLMVLLAKDYGGVCKPSSKARVAEETAVDEKRSSEGFESDLEDEKEYFTAKLKEMFLEFQPILKLHERQREDAEQRANELGEMSSVMFANYYSSYEQQPLIEEL